MMQQATMRRQRIDGRRAIRRGGALAVLLATGGMLVGTSSAAAVAVGQSDGDPSHVACFGAQQLNVQTATAADPSYVVPSDGTLTSFSTRMASPLVAGMTLRLVAFRPDPVTPGNFIVVGFSAESYSLPAGIPLAAVTTEITPLAVEAGDVIGYYYAGGVIGGTVVYCGAAGVTGDTFGINDQPAPVAGGSYAFNGVGTARLAISANFEPAASAACDQVLSPVGCWAFNEPPGSTTANDDSTFGNDGTYLNGPTLGVPGIAGTAVSLDGVNDLVRVPDASSLDVGDSFTAEGWIKRSSTAQTHQMFLKGSQGLQLSVMNSGSGNRVFLRKSNVTTLAQSSVGVPADGAFHHIVATKDGPGTAKIYIDGADVTVPTPGQQLQVIANTAFPLVFGSGASTPANYDEFAVYDQALTAAQVSARYNAAQLAG